MKIKEMFFAEAIDRLVTTDIPNRGIIRKIYSEARKINKNNPLAYTGAKLLNDRLKKGSIVYIATGWANRPDVNKEIWENDGPPGAVALARSLVIAKKVTPIILVENVFTSQIKEMLKAINIQPLNLNESIKNINSPFPVAAVGVDSFPINKEDALYKATELINIDKVEAVISIEKGGMSEKGEIHMSSGRKTTEQTSKIDFLINEAKKEKILTLGIGDGGNELGMGNIKPFILKHFPHLRKCICGCASTIVPNNIVDLLVTSSVSNWGAYAICACLSYLNSDFYIMHNQEMEKELMQISRQTGLIDGQSGFTSLSVDGISLGANMAITTLLRETVKKFLEK